MSKRKGISKGEARRWVQLHWAAAMLAADPPEGCPVEVAGVWARECDRMSTRIAPGYDVDEWKAANGQ